MNIKRLKPAFSDSRGDITDIVSSIPFEHATIIYSSNGVIRGNHYHKETIQYLYMIKGRMKCVSRMTGEEPIETIAETGDLIVSLPNESHAFKMLDHTTWLVLTRGPRGGQNYESDTYRLEVPLI